MVPAHKELAMVDDERKYRIDGWSEKEVVRSKFE
jgi:hypothetical protein